MFRRNSYALLVNVAVFLEKERNGIRSPRAVIAGITHVSGYPRVPAYPVFTGYPGTRRFPLP
eukprot:2629204-Rhodomonas_salina.1